MNKSFKARLEALEALETQAEDVAFDRAPLTPDDRELLYVGISVYFVVLDDSGLLARSQKTSGTAALDLALTRCHSTADSATFDRALSRCNAALSALTPRLTTIEDVDRWVRDLDDPDSFDEDELLLWVHWGLTKTPDIDYMLSFASGELRATATFPGALRPHWDRIAARAGPLLKERGIVLLPLEPEDARAAIEALDTGVITCRPLTERSWKSHHTTINSTTQYELRGRLVWAFDQVQYQTGGAFIETVDELRADLVAALGNMDHVPIQETT